MTTPHAAKRDEERNRWVAYPVLVTEGAVSSWEDVMVRPEDAASSPGFCVAVLAIGALEEEERKALGDRSLPFVDAQAMNVYLAEPFTRTEMMGWVERCVAAAGLTVSSMMEVGEDDFFERPPERPAGTPRGE